jgi:acetate---CoA ligase (ADP-forming)
MTRSPRERLRTALDPHSIAILGASDNPHKIGGRPLAYLSRFGFRGAVYPINPNRHETQGFRTYPDLSALPETPELAVIALPGDASLAAVEACARRGVQVAVVMTSGFGETDAAGKEKERRMAALAQSSGMRLIGPNAQGLANFGSGAVTSFSTMFIESPPADGPVAIVSQSGAMSVVPYGLLRQRGIGVRHAHATGNDCDVTACELASIVAEDPELRLLLLYLEGVPDPWNLAEAARVAREHELPVIALKAGRTRSGQEAARSHTGALASEDRVVDAFLEQHGIWRANTMADLVDGAELYLKGWRPKGGRLVAISNSGAVCVMAADAATQAGLPLAPLSNATQIALGGILPNFATTSNPIDITAALLTNSRLFGDILPIIARDPAGDVFLIGIPVSGTGYDVEGFVRDAAAFASATEKPLVIAAPQPGVADRFKAAGLVVFRTEAEAIRALSQFLAHQELMQRNRDRAPTPGRRYFPPAYRPRMLNEAASLQFFARHGLRVVRHRLCRSVAEVTEAFQTVGRPAVIKGCSADVAHKSEHGLVRLGVESADDAAAAYSAMEHKLKSLGARFDGVIVAAMVRGRDLMIGARTDPVFGPVVVVGDGGKYVEALPDFRTLLPPFGEEEVAAALSRLRIAPLFAGVRGEPPLDAQAFCQAVVAVGRMMMDSSAAPWTLDLNPVIVGCTGEGCQVADAVVYLRD